MKALATLVLLSSSLIAACSGGDDDSNSDCIEDGSGKCDIPDGTLRQQCANARVSAMDPKRPQFTTKGVRWSCADVAGVTPVNNTEDDRGQEYCEYFSEIHVAGIPEVKSDSCEKDSDCSTNHCDLSINSCITGTAVDTTQKAVVLGKNIDTGRKITALDPKLTQGQLDWLATNPTAKIGECVFTSWHNDIARDYSSAAEVGGFAVNSKTPGASSVPLFQMQVMFNANSAAKQLVLDCLKPGKKSIKDGFTRGCNLTATAGLPWRKSDPSVCTMAMRIAECECKVEFNDPAGKRVLDPTKQADLDILTELFVPTDRRGFELGTWDDMGKLPVGCRYIQTGDGTTVRAGKASFQDPLAVNTLVACDLNASHITPATAKDPKEACRQAYGNEVVVHVRAPDPSMATLKCNTSKAKCKGVPFDFANL